MEIYGLQKTTLLDYPGHIASTIFTGRCNFRCPFCHNGELVLTPRAQDQLAEEELLSFLKKRRGVIEGVCITGGEPTLQPDLTDFIYKIKELGLLVKLDTNGYHPDLLWDLLHRGLLDYVAMDIKASRAHYARAVGLPQPDLSRIESSIGILLSADIPYEFRTTVVKGIHTPEEFEEIGRWLAGCQAYFLQTFQENENCLSRLVGEPSFFQAFSYEEMKKMAALAGKYIDNVQLRGVK